MLLKQLVKSEFLYCNLGILRHGRARCVNTQKRYITKVGIIGLGMVGSTIVQNLQSSQKYNATIGFDVNLDTMKKIENASTGFQAAQSPSDVVKECDILLTCLPQAHDVKAVYDNHIKKNLTPRHTWIEHTSSVMGQNQQFFQEVSKIGSQFVEAPITGGMEALKKKAMTLLITGNEDLVKSLKPFFHLNFQDLKYLGSNVGAATVVKLITNTMNASQIVCMTEALLIAKRSGIDLNAFYHCVRASCGNSFGWETGVPEVFMGRYDTSFTIELHNKDLRNGIKHAKSLGVPVEHMELVLKHFEEVQQKYGNEAGCYSYPRLQEEKLGESLHVSGFNDWSWTIDMQQQEGGVKASVIKHKNLKPLE